MRSPWTFSSPGRKDLTHSCLSTQGRFFSPLLIFVALIWVLSSLPTSRIVGTRTGQQYSRWGPTSTEWDDHASISASNAPADAAQAPICLCACNSMLPTHIQPSVHQDPQVPFSKAGPSHTVPSLYWALWLHCPRCRTLHLFLLNFIQFWGSCSSSLSRSL